VSVGGCVECLLNFIVYELLLFYSRPHNHSMSATDQSCITKMKLNCLVEDLRWNNNYSVLTCESNVTIVQQSNDNFDGMCVFYCFLNVFVLQKNFLYMTHCRRC
jgi:hypothetical protein